MGKIAFVFAGQGAQSPGMGSALYRRSAAAHRLFGRASKIRPETVRQCLEGSAEELRETRVTQPCLYTVEMAAAAELSEAGISADMTAGFSLGELSALAYSGAISFEDGMRLVMKRGELMQEASEMHRTSMAAVLRLTDSQVSEICSRFKNVYPVNFNCPGQVTVSGDADEIEEFRAAVKEAGGRAVPLKVSGAFHSPFMAEAAESFETVLEDADFSAPGMPVYSNCTGDIYGDDIKASLSRQIDHPVRWERIIRNMIAAGADTFFELGPGNTLSGFIKRIDSSVRTFAVSDYEDISAVRAEVMQ